MSEAPERIWADRGPKGGWLYRDRKMPDSEHEYVRADLLAAKAAEIAALQAEAGRLLEALDEIDHWAAAYPEKAFTPLSDAEVKAAADAMQAAVRNGCDRMHASWARHLLDGVGGIARRALAGSREGDRDG